MLYKEVGWTEIEKIEMKNLRQGGNDSESQIEVPSALRVGIFFPSFESVRVGE